MSEIEEIKLCYRCQKKLNGPIYYYVDTLSVFDFIDEDEFYCRSCKKIIEFLPETYGHFVEIKSVTTTRSKVRAKHKVKYEKTVSNYYQEYEKEIHDYIIKNFEKGGLILELGSGRCNLLELLDEDYNVTGIDNNFPLVNYGREKGLTIFNRDIEKDLEDFRGLYDIILILQVLEHLEQPMKVLEDCKKLLKKSGKVIISVPNAHFLTRIINTSLSVDEYLSGHINAYDRTQLKTVAEFCNYKIDKMFFSGDVFPNMKGFGKILNRLFRNLKIFRRFSRRITCIISNKELKENATS